MRILTIAFVSSIATAIGFGSKLFDLGGAEKVEQALTSIVEFESAVGSKSSGVEVRTDLLARGETLAKFFVCIELRVILIVVVFVAGSHFCRRRRFQVEWS